jgi:flavin reductase (DIM6/NTAB) family NADH-FMN oxidoreductase RutF
MEFDPAKLTAGQRYNLLSGAILPRPIALVSTRSPSGQLNLAPFSFFNGFSASPMALAFSPVTKNDGTDKDTLRNVLPIAEGGTGEFVVNLVSARHVRRMAAAAEMLPADESEFDLSGFTPAPSRVVGAPRVQEVAVSYECRTLQVVRLAPGVPLSGNLVIGEVVHIWMNDDVVDDRFHVDLDRLDPIGRLSAAAYCRTTQRFDLPRGEAALTAALPFETD